MALVFLFLYRVLPGFTGLYRVIPGFTGFYWVLLGFTGFYWVLLGFTGFSGPSVVTFFFTDSACLSFVLFVFTEISYAIAKSY